VPLEVVVEDSVVERLKSRKYPSKYFSLNPRKGLKKIKFESRNCWNTSFPSFLLLLFSSKNPICFCLKFFGKVRCWNLSSTEPTNNINFRCCKSVSDKSCSVTEVKPKNIERKIVERLLKFYWSAKKMMDFRG
jgi:hypothetical protein